MKTHYDAIVIGAGLNALIAALNLSQKGFSVCVITESEEFGGSLQSAELIPGFRFNVVSLDAGLVEDEVLAKLGITDDLKPMPTYNSVLAPQMSGSAIHISSKPNETHDNLAQFSKLDAHAFIDWSSQVYQFADQLSRMAKLEPPSLQFAPLRLLLQWGKFAIGLRRLGGRKMMEFFRLLPMSMTRWINEKFENEAIKGLFAAASIKSLFQGPRAAGTVFNFLYFQMGGENASFARSLRFAGGNQTLIDILVEQCTKNGVHFHKQSTTPRILIENYRAIGIKDSSGHKFASKIVLSAEEATRTFFQYVGAEYLEPSFSRALRSFKLQGSTAILHFALSDLPQFIGVTNQEELSGRIVICPSEEYAEKAYDQAKYGEISHDPILEMMIPSLLDASLAPEGQHTLSIHYRYAPYQLRNSSWQAAKKELITNTLRTLEKYSAGISKLVIDQIVISPEDLEADYRLTEGSLSAGQMGLDQLLLMRPVPGFRGYQSPIDGLYLCGPSTHPGGGNSALPGWNASQQAIREM
jgi:phytoene dehydrogenase-like protein